MKANSLVISLCTLIALFLLNNNLIASGPIIVEGVDNVQETCNLGNGELKINISSDTTGLLYSIDGGTTFTSNNHFTNLHSGNFPIMVLDPSGCFLELTTQIADAPEPTVSISSECIEGRDRVTVEANPEGGILPYRFEWQGPNGARYTDETLVDVPPGDYIITVIDDLGCNFSDSISIEKCCGLELVCNPSDTVVTCASSFPEMSTFFTATNEQNEIINELSELGIDVMPNRCGDLNVSIEDTDENLPTCSKNELLVYRNYNISDGFSSMTCTKSILVENYIDVELYSDAIDIAVSCDQDVQNIFSGWIDQMGGMTYSDCADENSRVTIPANPAIDGMCGSFVEVEFFVQDNCGNEVSTKATFSVVDSIFPQLICPDDLIISPGSSDINSEIDLWRDSAIASDNCAQNLQILNNLTTDFSDPCSLSDLPVIFEVSDDCDNKTQCEANIVFLYNTPTINCPQNLTVSCDTDNLDAEINNWVELVIAENHDNNDIHYEIPTELGLQSCQEETEIVFVVNNNCGASADCQAQIIIIDQEAPIISCPQDLTINTSEEDVELMITSWLEMASADDCNLDAVEHNFTKDLSELQCSEIIPVTFRATDLCALSSNCSATLWVESDSTIEAICPEPISISCEDPLMENMIEAHLNSVIIMASNEYEMTSNFEMDLIDSDCSETSYYDIEISVIDLCDNYAECRSSIELVPEPKIYIPNVFSPDGDGLNDYFTVYSNSAVSMVQSLTIFNRWGDKVYEAEEFPTNDTNIGWDGKYRGKLENNNVYTYYAVLQDTSGNEIEKVGTVQILKK